MAESDPKKTWPARRIAALLLTTALLALLLYTLVVGVGDSRTRLLLGVGIVLGAMYTIRGGSLPPFMSQSDWSGGTGITADDDPRNLSPKLYLPILLAVVLLAAFLYYFCGPRR